MGGLFASRHPWNSSPGYITAPSADPCITVWPTFYNEVNIAIELKMGLRMMRPNNLETWVYLLSVPGAVTMLIGLLIGRGDVFANGAGWVGFVICSFVTYVFIGATVMVIKEKWRRK